MNVARRPRLFFDEGHHPATVTFTDDTGTRRNLPWSHFYCAVWSRVDPTTIRIEIGEWQVVISGHNLEPLFAAIEGPRLARVQTYPEFADDPAHEVDVFATSIRFVRHEPGSAGKGPAQLRLPV